MMGADHVIKVETKDSKKLANQIKDTMGVAPDITIRCPGVESSAAMAIYVSVEYGYHVLSILLLGNSFRRSSSPGRARCSHGNSSHSRCIS